MAKKIETFVVQSLTFPKGSTLLMLFGNTFSVQLPTGEIVRGRVANGCKITINSADLDDPAKKPHQDS